MNSSNADGAKKPGPWLMISSSFQVKAGIILVLIILYAITFKPITERYGLITAPMIAIPVVLAGWFFGNKVGFLVSLISILLNAALYKFTLFNGWSLWMETSWPGNLMIIAIGLISGYLHTILNESTRIEAELRSRERYLTLLKLATSNILNPKDPADRHYYLITHLATLFVADHGYFFRWDATQKQAILVASTSPFDQPFPDIVLKSRESAIIESILQTERTLVIDNVLNSQDTFNSTLFKNLACPIHSVLSIPLIVQDRKLGIVILAYNTLRHFTAD